MKIAFRVDASVRIGTGHIMRCIALANALREHGAAVFFVCREHEGHLFDLLEERGFAVSRLPAPKVGTQTEDTPAHATWLGASWQEDAEQTSGAIEAAGAKPDWLVVDHYALGSRWESALRTSVERIMVIDDLADRVHDCDLLLDQNLVAQMHTRYAGKVPPVCGMLLGPECALLQPIYAELHDRTPPRKGPIRRIFIFFGGADSDNLTGRTLAAFLHLNLPDIEVDVVITASSPHAEVIRRQVVGHGNIHLHSDLPTLALLMIKADLALGAGGATSWERLCLGLPSLVVTLSENQRLIADELSRRDLIRWLGHQDMVDQTAIAQVLGELIQQGLDEGWSRRCLAAVDGNGIKRVCSALTVTATTPLRVRYAKLEDEALLLAWANDPVTRRNGFSPENIPAATHRIWFRDRLQNQDGCRLYIVETTEGVALGQVRFERHGEAWEVHYAFAPVFRARGLGRPLLEAALLKLRAEKSCASVFGRVKDDNHSSRKIFESLGFEVQPNAARGVTVYRRAYNAAGDSVIGSRGLCK
ncbi:MAG: UDP-2,4-diacetamido-2,4,6-trideoxy-beta-L-altropyranose hydrolase [Methylococcales bacterium]